MKGNLSRRSLLKKGVAGGVGLMLPTEAAVAKYQEHADPYHGEAIKQFLSNHEFRKAYDFAKKHEVPYVQSTMQVNPTQSEDGGTIQNTKIVNRYDPSSEDDMSTQDLFIPPGGQNSSYIGLGGYCSTSGHVGLSLYWSFEVRPQDEWEEDLPTPRDGASISFVQRELTPVPDSGETFEYADGNTQPKGLKAVVNDDKQMKERNSASDPLAGDMFLEVTFDGTTSSPVVYGDYVHTWKQLYDYVDFSFTLGVGGVTLSGSGIPHNWRAEDEIYAAQC